MREYAYNYDKINHESNLSNNLSLLDKEKLGLLTKLGISFSKRGGL